MADEAIIRIRPLGGAWETIGADRLRGIVPEAIEAATNESGPDTLNFVLKAEEGARRPDVLPYTPVDFEIGGLLCWSGFVWTRPSDANGYSVGCRGWQYHLDDDLVDRAYVHTRMSDYVDARSFLVTNLGTYRAAWDVQSTGQVYIALPEAATAPNLGGGCVVLDLGPDSVGKQVAITYKSGGAAGFEIVARSGDTADPSSAAENVVIAASVLATTDTGVSTTFTTARRYVFLEYRNNSGGVATGTSTSWLRISAINVFRLTAYASGGASILKADTVVKDALALAPLLNQSTALIQAGTFTIPEYLTSGYLTPRQLMEAVNAYENYRLKIGGADLMRLVFDPKPSAPLYEVGDWSGAEFSDATVSGEPIYSRAIVDATGPDGARLVSKRTQTGTLVDRRGFTRSMSLPISTAVTQAVADRFGDLWLTEHRTAPFSGTLLITGASARNVLSGRSVPAHEFLLAAGEKFRISNRVDPDTGGWGRDGRIAGVTYRHDLRQASIAIDDRRDNFERILGRYGVLVDQIR